MKGKALRCGNPGSRHLRPVSLLRGERGAAGPDPGRWARRLPHWSRGTGPRQASSPVARICSEPARTSLAISDQDTSPSHTWSL